MNKKELGSDFYDNAYLSAGSYSEHYSKSVYFQIWKKIISKIKDSERIIDLGCGTGQFAHMCVDNGKRYSMGIDFSEVAIGKCIKLLPSDPMRFQCASLYDLTLSNTYDVVVILETLEHLKDDFAVIDKIPSNTMVIASVPSFDSVSHVRHFKTKRAVLNRYKEVLDIIKIDAHKFDNGNKIFTIYATAK